MKSRLYFIFALLAFSTFAVNAQQPEVNCPMHEKHQASNEKLSGKTNAMRHDGMGEMNERGNKAMGFPQSKTTHHFRLLGDGGAIEVEANNPQDIASRDQIRIHLQHISQMFSQGNFDAPMFIHDQTPPGVPDMQRLKSEIEYGFEQTARGGRVRIKTSSAEALAAVYEFLRFQIREHDTADSLESKD
jgi:hypothetical protein